MKKIIVLIAIISCACALVSAQEKESESVPENTQENAKVEKDFQNHIVPVLGFEALQIDEKDYLFTPSVAAQFIRVKSSGVESKQPDAVIIASSYGQTISTKGIGPDEVKTNHALSLMGNVVYGKNTITAMFANNGQVLFNDYRDITAGLLYSRQLVKNDSVSFSLGGGVMMTDLGLNIGGVDIIAIPLPIFSFSYTSEIFKGSCSFMGAPSISAVLFPKAMFRLKGECGVAGFKSIRDITFDCAVAYYPLKNTKAGDFLSFSAGVMNKHKGFATKDPRTKYTYQYYGVYGEINASLISLRAGYNFDGKLRVKDKDDVDLHKGIFASVQAMYMF